MTRIEEFISDLFNEESHYNYPPARMTLHEASYNLSCYLDEGLLDVPDDLSPALFRDLWNAMVDWCWDRM